MNPSVWSFVDLETTGSSFNRGRILEIGILQIENGKEIHRYQTVINPQCAIPPFITQMTGITFEEIEAAPTFEQVAETVWEMLQGTLFIAHNAQFDYGFLSAEFKRLGKNFALPRICTVRLSRSLYPRFRKHSLDAIIERYGFSCYQRHRAFDDAHVLHQFFEHIGKDFGPEVLEQHLRTSARQVLLPPHLQEEELTKLPNTPGVYIFYGEQNHPLYIGKSTQIRTRVLSHFSSSKSESKEYKIFSQVKNIECIETAGELGALLLESELIKSMKPLHKQKLRRAQQVAVIKEWPYDGPVLIKEEKNKNEGELFIFHNWTLIAKGQFSEQFLELRELSSMSFDRDAYKIVRSHIKSAFKVKPLKWEEYKNLLTTPALF